MEIKARTPAPLSWAPGGPVTNCQHLNCRTMSFSNISVAATFKGRASFSMTAPTYCCGDDLL